MWTIGSAQATWSGVGGPAASRSAGPPGLLAEAISFSTGEVVLFLLLLAGAVGVVVLTLVLGAIGFYRQGRRDSSTLIAKMAWFIGLLDVGMILGGVRASVVVVAPLVLHAGMFAVGRLRGPKPPAAPAEPPAAPAEPPAAAEET